MEDARVGNVTLVARVGVAEEVLSSVAKSVMVSADKDLQVVVDMGTVWA